MALVSHPLVELVLGCAIEVHRQLGPGLLESSYTKCLTYEFVTHSIPFRTEVLVPVKYKDVNIDCGYRADLIVEDWLLLEIKSVERLLPIHSAQVITYLKLSDARQAILINFNSIRLMDGVKSFLAPRPQPSD